MNCVGDLDRRLRCWPGHGLPLQVRCPPACNPYSFPDPPEDTNEVSKPIFMMEWFPCADVSCLVIPPMAVHELTLVLLHGREPHRNTFHNLFLLKDIAGKGTVREILAHARIVIPSAPPTATMSTSRRLTRNRFYERAWDWESAGRGGTGACVQHIHRILRDEATLLRGCPKRVVLAGIGSGCSMALTTLLLWEGAHLGAAIGLCGSMELSPRLIDMFDGTDFGIGDGVNGQVFSLDVDEVGPRRNKSDRGRDSQYRWPEAVALLRHVFDLPATATPARPSVVRTPIFMGHGAVDTTVPPQCSQATAQLLARMGFAIQWRQYQGVGHTYSEEMLKELLAFVDEKVGLY
jgi:predicted esterase